MPAYRIQIASHIISSSSDRLSNYSTVRVPRQLQLAKLYHLCVCVYPALLNN